MAGGSRTIHRARLSSPAKLSKRGGASVVGLNFIVPILVPLSLNRRLDALTKGGKQATEIERSGNPATLAKAAQRLGASESPWNVLQVPQKDMPAAADAMRKVAFPRR